AIVLSVVTALTLTPALSAMLVRPSHGSPRGFFKWFEAGLNRLRAGYRWSLERVLSPAGLAGTAVAFIALCALVGVIWQRVPTGFVPVEDQGYFIVIVQAPEGTSLERTSQIVARIEGTLLDDEDIESTFVPIGFSFEGTAPNRATLFPILRERAERDGEEHTAEAVMARMQVAFSSIPEASIVAIPPPPIRGLGNLGGFELRLEDRIDSGLASLDQQTSQLTAAANADPRVTNTFSTFQANDPQFRVDVDRDRARALGVPLDELFGTIQVLLGSVYVNDFELEARPYRVYVQADAPYRTHPQDIDELYVRSNTGRMVPLANLVQLEEEATPQIISHFNMFRSATINGGASPGSSSGDAIDAMTELSDRELPPGFAIEWSGLAQEELESRGQTATLFGLGLLVIFLILAAQYESVVLPFVILLSVPMAVLGAIGAQALRGLTNDVFCQVGLLMLVGLAAKNAILIVEFVEQLRKEQGKPLREAVVEACAVRLRPILMTSFAFIMGVIPLVVAGGAGQAARQSLGTAVFGGMIVSTVLNLFVVPVAYMLTVRIRDRVGALMPSSRQPKKAESVPAE
ncbi:MAG: efflux RND transporter permease subunit, partial [Myxococcota bacterium]